MDLFLHDKVAIVTGGNKGFGAATARLLAKEGAQLLLTARNIEHLEDVASTIRNGFGTRVDIVSADVTIKQEVDNIVERAMSAYGRIDILVNCAGASQGGDFLDIPEQVWEDSMNLKFMGTVRMLRAVLPVMKAQKYGRIVNVIGNTGKQPNSKMLPGSAANAALLALNTGLAHDVAKEGIVMNAVNPGPSRTERWDTLIANIATDTNRTVEGIEQGFMDDIPMNRLGDPDEIARHIVYLCSSIAGNITGTSLTADGGWTRSL